MMKFTLKMLEIVFIEYVVIAGLFPRAHGVCIQWNQWNHEPLTTYTGEDLNLMLLLLLLLKAHRVIVSSVS